MVMIGMTQLLVLALAAAAEAPPDLIACGKDSDCVLVEGTCQSPVAINKKYEPRVAPADPKAKESEPLLLPVTLCMNGFVPGYWPPGAKAVCRNRECSVQVPPAPRKSDI